MVGTVLTASYMSSPNILYTRTLSGSGDDGSGMFARSTDVDLVSNPWVTDKDCNQSDRDCGSKYQCKPLDRH